MVDPEIIRIVRRYLSVLRQHNIPATGAVVYGSHARGSARPDSDIDVLVVSPAFDSDRWSLDRELWQLALKVDPRIEPVPIGQRQMLEDRASPLVEIARREGIAIRGDEQSEGSPRSAAWPSATTIPVSHPGELIRRPR